MLLEAIIFYLIFTAVYGLMNWLVFCQAAWAFGLDGWLRAAIRAWFWVMVVSPVAAMFLGDRTGPFSLVIYTWLGLVFYFFLAALITLPLRIWGGVHWARPVWTGILVVVIAVGAWGIYAARQPQVTELTLTTAKLPPGVDEVTVVQITDLHLYSVEAEGRLKRIVDLIRPLKPDLIVSTGDLVEIGMQTVNWAPTARTLAELKPRWGKYAVDGNHENYLNRAAGSDLSSLYHRAAGFRLLRDEVALPGEAIRLIGFKDLGRNGIDDKDRQTEARLLAEKSDLFTLLLKHQPLIDAGSPGRFDVQLSGHTHAGQIWPFTYLVKWRYPYLAGLYNLGSGSRIFTSVGAGTWGPPMRVGAPPEVVLIRIKRE